MEENWVQGMYYFEERFILGIAFLWIISLLELGAKN